MINIKKSPTVPSSLAEEKSKPSSENYRGEDVLRQLREDFNNKCYICEDKAPSTLNVEHFKPHRGVDRDLMFSWSNLFLSCGHCNNTKGHKAIFDDILDCTNENHRIIDWMKFTINPFPYEQVQITALIDDVIVRNTVELLLQSYNGTTNLKTIEAENICNRLIDEMFEFSKKLNSYFIDTNTNHQREEIRDNVRRMLSVKSCFTAFKIWTIKGNRRLLNEFGVFLPQ
jgi:uncharacterized protein (TIGR02646 family)